MVMSVIILKPKVWDSILEKIKAEYPPSYWMIRDRMRRELGFTVRRHSQWISSPGEDFGYYQDQIHLDFYNEAAQTFFSLKYLNN